MLAVSKARGPAPERTPRPANGHSVRAANALEAKRVTRGAKLHEMREDVDFDYGPT